MVLRSGFIPEERPRCVEEEVNQAQDRLDDKYKDPNSASHSKLPRRISLQHESQSAKYACDDALQPFSKSSSMVTNVAADNLRKDSKHRHSEARCVPRNPSCCLLSNPERFLTSFGMIRKRLLPQTVKPESTKISFELAASASQPRRIQ